MFPIRHIRTAICATLLCGLAPLIPGSGNAQPAPPEPAHVERQIPWTAMETEMLGLWFRVPRRLLHIRLPSGSFEYGLRIQDFSPIALLGLNDEVFWRTALKIVVGSNGNGSGPQYIESSIETFSYIRRLQITNTAHQISDPGGVWQDHSPPQGLYYYPAPAPTNQNVVHVVQDVFIPEHRQRSAATGEELPEVIMCSSNPPRRSDPTRPALYPCQWLLVFRNLAIRVTLSREHLVRWREIRSGVVQTLEAMLIPGIEEAQTPPPGWRPPMVPPVLIYDPK
jgi:hypothetical protein